MHAGLTVYTLHSMTMLAEEAHYAEDMAMQRGIRKNAAAPVLMHLFSIWNSARAIPPA